jgi:AAA+ superfamily predicted ATPase
MESATGIISNVNNLYFSPLNLTSVELTKNQHDVHDQIVDVANLFFKSKKKPSFKINGFLIHGKPQSGKTETVKQICISLGKIYPGMKCCFVDAANIASPLFGNSEKYIDAIFSAKGLENIKRVIFIDDIDCLFFGREYGTAQTWHISMSSVMFHRLDNLQPDKVLFLATSNKKELLDSAMQSRLMQIELKMPTRDELVKQIDLMIESIGTADTDIKEEIKERIKKNIKENETGFRDIQFQAVKYMTEMVSIR